MDADSFRLPGAFSAEPGRAGYRSDWVLARERHPMRTGSQQDALVIDGPLPKPLFVGINPYGRRNDRNSDDNPTRVEPE